VNCVLLFCFVFVFVVACVLLLLCFQQPLSTFACIVVTHTLRLWPYTRWKNKTALTWAPARCFRAHATLVAEKQLSRKHKCHDRRVLLGARWAHVRRRLMHRELLDQPPMSTCSAGYVHITLHPSDLQRGQHWLVRVGTSVQPKAT
jgi:hypothetical protein